MGNGERDWNADGYRHTRKRGEGIAWNLIQSFLKNCAALAAATGETVTVRRNSIPTPQKATPRLSLLKAPKEYLHNQGIDINLKPVMQLETAVVSIREIKKGTSISYGRTWIADKDTNIAVLPIGYADGLLRRNSPNMKVTINGKEYPICGRICMDQCMIDIGLNNKDVKRWDKVIIFGPKQQEALQDAADIAKMTNTIPYEIITSVSAKRVQKYFI